jgi:pimeloyl-ACP methyl ester carboxylesterase
VSAPSGFDIVTHGDGPGVPVVYFHGAGGLFPVEPTIDGLVAAGHTVYAPVWPGYGAESPDEMRLRDMLDFALYGWDAVDSLGLPRPPVLMGHSMGGMIAAEMATLARRDLAALVLVCPAGLWDDAEPIPDIFAMLPFELAEVLFADPVAGEKLLTAGQDFSDDAALSNFLVQRARRLGMAGKILFPVPCRHIERRLYRIGVPTLLAWGERDKLIPPSYADRWAALVDGATVEVIPDAAHMLPYEQPAALSGAAARFLTALP